MDKKLCDQTLMITYVGWLVVQCLQMRHVLNEQGTGYEYKFEKLRVVPGVCNVFTICTIQKGYF